MEQVRVGFQIDLGDCCLGFPLRLAFCFHAADVFFLFADP
jgi:hypothetical protein